MISDLSKRVSEMDVRLANKERLLRAQFTKMETALAQIQQQSSWLSGQLGSLK